MKQQKVRKAIIPAAGYGTRFLPATKAQPKEMLPVVDKPIIQYVVEDAIAAGITDIIIVSGWLKRSIEDHFDHSFELERRLEEAGKTRELDEVRKISDAAHFHFVRQKGPLGNATPIWNARHFVGDEPFLVLWGDEFMDAEPSRSTQLIRAFNELGSSAVIASVSKSAPEDYRRYGYAAGHESSPTNPGKLAIERIVEKPGAGVIDSDYALIGGSVYTSEMFDAIEEAMRRHEKEQARRELVYVDAIKVLMERGRSCHAIKIADGEFYDCGDKLEYLKAVVRFGLKREDLGASFAAYLKELYAIFPAAEAEFRLHDIA